MKLYRISYPPLRTEQSGGSFINSIKALRTVYHEARLMGSAESMDLRTAKDIMETIKWSTFKEIELNSDLVVLMFKHGFQVDIVPQEAYNGDKQGFIRCVISRPFDNKKINAIKGLRNATGWGLKESKEFMDEMWVEHTDSDHIRNRYANNGGRMIYSFNVFQIEQLRANGFTVDHRPENQFEREEDLFRL